MSFHSNNDMESEFYTRQTEGDTTDDMHGSDCPSAIQYQGLYQQLPIGSPNLLTSSSAHPTQISNRTVQADTRILPGPVGNDVSSHTIPVEKSLEEAYLLWLFFGLVGGHHFYLKRPCFGLVYFFTFGLLGFGWLIDMARMPYLVSQTNIQEANPLLSNKKNISDAYTLWFPFGLIGFHHFYLGNTWLGFIYALTFGVFGIGWLLDLFLIPWYVEVINERGDETRKKTIHTAYLAAVPHLGIIGMHHFYLNRTNTAIFYLFTLGQCGIGWIADLFRIPILVKRANKAIQENDVNTKYLDDAYILWFPFGLIGAHHFYLNRPGWGILYFVTLGVFGIGWFIDLVRMPRLVKDANELSHERKLYSAYLIGISPLGILGIHHFYLNRPITGTLYFFTFGLLGVGWMMDWFRMPILVERANKEIYEGCDKRKYLDDAYILWFPFGLIGIHQFYLNRPIWGILYFSTLALLGIGWIMDGCRMHRLVNDHNTRLRIAEERRLITSSHN